MGTKTGIDPGGREVTPRGKRETVIAGEPRRVRAGQTGWDKSCQDRTREDKMGQEETRKDRAGRVGQSTRGWAVLYIRNGDWTLPLAIPVGDLGDLVVVVTPCLIISADPLPSTISISIQAVAIAVRLHLDGDGRCRWGDALRHDRGRHRGGGHCGSPLTRGHGLRCGQGSG